MGTSKRERQKAGHRARLSAERAAYARYERRRRITLVAAGVVGVVLLGVLAVVLSRSGDSTATPTSSTTSTTEALASVAGQPCVALADTLPAGSPDVPVPVGDPPTELQTEDLVVGNGTPVAPGDDVTVQYTGVRCSDGTIFDSTWTDGQPGTFPLAASGGLIKGWTEGIPGMEPGGRRLLVIPPDLAYGDAGRGDIAPGETLVFVIDLVSSTPAEPASTAPATATTP